MDFFQKYIEKFTFTISINNIYNITQRKIYLQNPVGNVVCRIVLWLSAGNGDLGQNKEMVGSDRLSSASSL